MTLPDATLPSDGWSLPVIPKNKILNHREMESLTVSVISNEEFSDLGFTMLVTEIRKRTPIFPVFDVLVKECIRQARLVLQRPGVVPDDYVVHIAFETDEPEDLMHRAVRHVKVGMHDRRPGNNMYLDLIGRSDDNDLVSMVRVLFDLLNGLRSGEAMVWVTNSRKPA